MALRDIILQMNSYPEAAPDWALKNATVLASTFGARLSVGVCQVHIPPVSNWLANKLINSGGMIAAENRKSSENAKALLSHFTASVDERMRGEALLLECPGMVTHWQLASRARSYDLLIVPVDGHEQALSVEGLTFETGRPLLLLTEGAQDGRFDHVVIGWDGSRAAARALADSLCFCAAAKTVKVAAVTGDKDLSPTTPVSDVVRHLGHHGITASAQPPGVMQDKHCKPIAWRRRAVCWSWVPMGIRGFVNSSWVAPPDPCSNIQRFRSSSRTNERLHTSRMAFRSACRSQVTLNINWRTAVIDPKSAKSRLEEQLSELERRQKSITEDLSEPLNADLSEQAVEKEDDASLEAQAALIASEIGSVRRALSRIENGTYGACVHCGGDIAPQRLEARPEAALCIDCAQKES